MSTMLSDTILLTLVHILLRGITMLFQAFLSRRIGAEGLGLLQLVYNAGGFAVTLGLSGIRTAAMYICAEKFGKKQHSELPRTVSVCFLYGFVCSLVASALLFIFSGIISAAFIKIEGAEDALAHFAFGILPLVLSSVLSGYFTACKQIKKLLAVEIFDRLLSCALTVFLLRFDAENTAAAVRCCIDAGTISSVMTLLLLGLMAAKQLSAYRTDPKRLLPLKEVASVSVPLALNAYLRSGLSSIEHFLIPLGLNKHLGSAEASLAQYGKLHGMVFPLMMFPAVMLESLAELLVPELSRLSAQNNLVRTRCLVKKCVRLGFFYSAAIAYLLFLLAQPLVTLVYGDVSIWLLLRIFAPMVLILYADSIVDAMCKGLGKHIQCVRINIFCSVPYIAALYFLLPRYGLYGYIATFALVHVINFYFSIRLLLKTVSWTPNILPMLKCVLCIIICAALCLAVPKMLPQGVYCVVCCTVFLFAYVYLLKSLRVLRKTELISLRFR